MARLTLPLRRFSRPRLSLHRRTARRNLVACTLGLVAAIVTSYSQMNQDQAVYRGGPLYALETAAQDVALRGRDPSLYGSALGKDPRELITIIALDNKSLAELGHWQTWPRSYYARMTDELLAQPPRAIVFDIGFFEPKPEDPELASAMMRARSRRPATAVVLAAAGGGLGQDRGGGYLQYEQGLQPVPLLAENADIGAANVVPDDLGTVRQMPVAAVVGDTLRPSLGLAGVARYLRRPNFDVERPDRSTIRFTNREIPVTPLGLVRVNYFGPPSVVDRPEQNTFRVLSFVDVLNGRADPSVWRDDIVYVGLLDATGFADDYWTPVSDAGRKMAGVEIHANLAATLLSTQFLREAPLGLQVGIIFLLTALITVAAANFGILRASLFAIAALGLYVAGNLAALDQGTQLPLVNPIVAAILAFMSITAYRVLVEQRQARALQGALASVIPPTVAHEIARDPERVKMGGERRTISVLFTDLKGFTTFSESVSPELLSRVITEYLDAMTAVIFAHGGTVDKFIGDAVMAFWNAPLDVPDHASRACAAALEMQATLARLGDKWEAEGLPRQYMRIGINTGPVSVGNMGTTQRFAYTALGDTVNLGARLEPLNNEYGTWICLSQATLDAAGGRESLLVRFLDLVAVKGKNEPAPVYELIGRADDIVLKQRYDPVLTPYHQAMVLYQARQFEAAAALFEQALDALGPEPDGPSAVYVERCKELVQAPPEPTWDGVYVMHHK